MKSIDQHDAYSNDQLILAFSSGVKAGSTCSQHMPGCYVIVYILLFLRHGREPISPRRPPSLLLQHSTRLLVRQLAVFAKTKREAL